MSLRGHATIATVRAREIFDSRGRPTVETEVTLAGGAIGVASAPSGASKGTHEAHELRDGDSQRNGGFGVRKAVAHVNTEIANRLVGEDATRQTHIDAALRELDGTEFLYRLGANAVLATSLAVCRAAASVSGLPLYRHIANLCGNPAPSLPLPMVNILSGGAHAGWSMDVQDFLVIPHGAASFDAALQMSLRVRSAADAIAAQRGLSRLLADEGGLAPGFERSTQALDFMLEAIEGAGLVPGQDVSIALDIAASELFDAGVYCLNRESLRLRGEEMIELLHRWSNDYPIVSIEDALHQDDWEHWSSLVVATKLQIVGDDLFATNLARLRRGVEAGAANAVLIKPNQNGTLSGTLEVLHEARRTGVATIISARSGETEDSFIADLAVGTSAGQIKIGSVRTSERFSKYNRLLQIGEDAGLAFATPFHRSRL